MGVQGRPPLLRRSKPSGRSEMHLAWQEKAARMRADGITVYTRALSYRSRRIHLPDGSSRVVRVAKEKGIDVRISLDVLELTYEGAFDVAVLFCRDQDLSELVPKIN